MKIYHKGLLNRLLNIHLQTGCLGPPTTYLHLSVDKCSQISRVVGVPDVYVMRRNIQLLVSGAQELQLGEPDLQGVPPV